VYQAPYSIIKNYQTIEKRLDQILPVNLEDTLIYKTIRPPKAQPLSCEITDKEINLLFQADENLSFKERTNLEYNLRQIERQRSGQGSIFKRMSTVRQKVATERIRIQTANSLMKNGTT
jgi:hypothetical protein